MFCHFTTNISSIRVVLSKYSQANFVQYSDQ